MSGANEPERPGVVGESTPARLLIVDDEEPIRRLLARVLDRTGYTCVTAGDAGEAVGLLEDQDFDLVLTDVNLPGQSGLWLAAEVVGRYPGTAVVMVTGVDDTALAREALGLGAYGYVIKPFEANEIVINVFNALRRRQLEIENRRHRDHLSQLVGERTAALELSLGRLADADRALRRSHEATVRRLALAAEFHDPTTGEHLLRMSSYSAALARAIGIEAEQVELIRTASPMHDIGKIGIPDDILRKPGRLTADDLVVMRQHPQIGYDLLAGSESELLDLGALIALTHHERYDGTGYPDGTEGDQIPLEGRIVALADVFDALTSERPYKRAFPFDRALAMIVDERGRHFDPELADAFVALRPELEAIARSAGTVEAALA